jgi:ribosomal protein L6, bacterial type
VSRIGKLPISIPKGVEIKIEDGNVVTVKGSKATLTKKLHQDMIITKEADEVVVTRPSDSKQHRSLHGLTRTLINNMVVGVSEGYKKDLEINGVGYRASMQGKKLVMNLGYSHPVEVDEIPGITISVAGNIVTVSGPDKQAVGQFAAEIREKRPPEPYKGKGIKYTTEVIKRKEGKTGAKK